MAYEPVIDLLDLGKVVGGSPCFQLSPPTQSADNRSLDRWEVSSTFAGIALLRLALGIDSLTHVTFLKIISVVLQFSTTLQQKMHHCAGSFPMVIKNKKGDEMRSLRIVLLMSISYTATTGHAQAAADLLPEIEVIAPTPLGESGGVDRSLLPSTTQTVTATDIERTNSPSISDALNRTTPGVALSDVQGNGLSQDLTYRGFYASPLQGVAQGLAVYQNGVRINEGFGDTVNWDLIPPNAVSRIDLWSSNPIFGLNAIGGAVSLCMKNGFNWQGREVEARVGSHGQVGSSFQYGVERDDFAFYAAGDALRDNGWRKFSPSNLLRGYADFGWRREGAEIHIIASGASNRLGVVGPTPIEALSNDLSAVYTSPQTTTNEKIDLAVNGSFPLAGGWTLSGGTYVRRFVQSHTDGNTADIEKCSSRSSYPTSLCLQDDPWGTPAGGKTTAWRNQFVLLGSDGQPIPFASATTPYGVIDRTNTLTTTFGGTVQGSNRDQIVGRDNLLTVGASVDQSETGFRSSSTLGYISPDLQVGSIANIPGMGSVLHTLGNVGYVPVDLGARSTYFGLYGVDTFNLTQRLALTAGARLNLAAVTTRDRSGAAAALDGDHRFSRFNPMVGFAWMVADDTTVFAGYSEANRAPTPLELSCSDPLRPCLVESAMVSDPPLKQVVSHTYEAGLRGTVQAGLGKMEWKFAAYRANLTDDIVALASTLQGRGYYANVPGSRRQGIEIGLAYEAENWSGYVNYAFVDATWRFKGQMASSANPAADANGFISVTSGARIPSIPAHQLKIGGDYQLMPKWKIGGDIVVMSSQYLRGDDSNENPKLPGYWVANLRTSWQATSNVQLFAQANNVFNRRSAVFGAFFDPTNTTNAIVVPFTNPVMQTVLPPLSIQAGIKVKL